MNPAELKRNSSEYPCPGCGHLSFIQPPGSYDICGICFWEDDRVQLGFPMMAGGANRVSLHDAQQEFVRSGAIESRFKQCVRSADDSDRRAPSWRPFDPANDLHLLWHSEEDLARWKAVSVDSCLYYWRPEFWL